MDPLTRLIAVLEREAQVADDLLGRMVAVRLLVAAGETRMLGRAADEIDDLSERLGTMELLREVVVAELRNSLGIDPLGQGWSLGALLSDLQASDLTTDDLQAVAHRLATTVGEISELQPDIAALLMANADVARDRRERLEQASPVVTYGASGGR